mmetsp:Transcript_32926/g.104831  ORF Transcript_32926/g.104831 Transcript_32926/m.104831 type:complete len:682 (+) Transcript_32926:199-2244(+)
MAGQLTFTDLSEANAAARMQAMWKAQVVKKQLAEERQLLESSTVDDDGKLKGRANDDVPSFAETFSLAFSPIIAFIILVLVVFQVIVILALIVSFSIFIDDLTTTSSDGKAATIEASSLYAMALLGACVAVITMLKSLLTNLGGESMVVNVRTKLVTALGNRRQAWFDDQRLAVLTTMLGPSVDVVRDCFFKCVITCCFDLGNIICGVVALAIINVEAMGITLAIVPALAILAFVNSIIMRKYQAAYDEANGRGNVEASEFIESISAIRAMGTQDKEIQDYLDSVKDTSSFYRKMSWSGSVYDLLSILLGTCGLVVLMYFEGTQVEDNKMSVGTVITALAIAVFTVTALQSVFFQFLMIQKGKVAAEKMLILLNRAEADDETFTSRLGAKHPDFSAQNAGAISFRKVQFWYRTRPAYRVLDNFSLEIPTGKTVALVGHSGGGKSTVANLLMRAYRCREGEITIDGTDIVDFDDEGYSQEVGMVGQEPVMFAGSVSYNITYGFNGVLSQEDIITAAKFADCHRFISRLPQGYDTIIGEGFLKLSPGQKQRIAIARIFAKNPSICILDEPCNGLDPESALAVRVAIRRMLRYPVRRTGLLIAHDKEEMAAADTVAFLVGGSITEVGAPDDLLRDSNSKFARLMQGEVVVRAGAGAGRRSTAGVMQVAVQGPPRSGYNSIVPAS